jgi:hypothetical protein
MRVAWIVMSAGAGLGTVACGSGDDNVVPVPVVASGDASVSDGTASAKDATTAMADGASANATPPPSAPTAFLRVANWSPDSPAIDFCVAPHGTGAFVGPIVATLASTDAGSDDLAFPSVSAYASVPAATQYDARVVVAGAGSCAVGILPDATPLPALATNAFATIALVGEAHPTGGDAALQVVGFLDDALTQTNLTLRAVNAVPSWPQADLTLNAVTVFSGVGFGAASTKAEAQAAVAADASAPSVDSNGYLTLSAPVNGTIGAVLHGSTQAASDAAEQASVASASAVSAVAGAALTIAIVGGTSSGIPLALVECVDNGGTAGSLSNCICATAIDGVTCTPPGVLP